MPLLPNISRAYFEGLGRFQLLKDLKITFKKKKNPAWIATGGPKRWLCNRRHTGSQWQLAALWFNPELTPQCACGFLWVLSFPPTIQQHTGRQIGYSKLSLGMNVCVRAHWRTIRRELSRVSHSVPGISFRSTTTLIRIAQLLKMDGWREFQVTIVTCLTIKVWGWDRQERKSDPSFAVKSFPLL